jgi:methionine-rich copper-binding protein CopC
MLVRLVMAVLLLVGGASASLARRLLDQASPRPGGSVRRAPSHVALSFTERLLPSRSDAVVRSATGAVVSSGKARVIDNKEMQVPVNSLPSGSPLPLKAIPIRAASRLLWATAQQIGLPRRGKASHTAVQFHRAKRWH